MNPFKISIQVTCLIVLGLAAQARAQTYPTTLHAFTGQLEESDNYPYARLILSGSTCYGTAYGGSENSEGTVFKVNTNGTGFTVLHTFTGGTDGANPVAGFVLSDGVLYGTASGGGGSDSGTVFSVSTSGTGFKVLHTFTGGSDGGTPLAGLVLSGSTLYGTTSGGGDLAANGVVFKVSTSGSGFSVLHRFDGGNDGSYPESDLILSGSTLYGTASAGGTSESGTVFKVSTSGTGFKVLHTFYGGGDDGGVPLAGLVLSGSTLYSTTYGGGINGFGTVFKVNTDGSGFRVLYPFAGGSDGGFPSAGLILSGSTLYGTSSTLYGTSSGGSGQNGTVFSINTHGTGFNTLHSFSGSDGNNPVAALTLSGSTLYGTTPYGGRGAQTTGTLFKINTNGASFATVYNFAAVTYTDGAVPQAGPVRSGNMLYGTTTKGGDFSHGSVFQVTIYGTLYKTLYSFTGGADGDGPQWRLVLSGNTLYGTTPYGGSNGDGTVFKVNTDGSSFSVLHPFAGGSDGSTPSAGLVLSGSTLYGTTYSGSGGAGGGTVFKIGTNGSGYSILHPFSGNDGAQSEGTLVLSGSTLYGTTSSGAGSGEVFKVGTNGTGFAIIHPFPDPGTGDGLYPSGDLALSGSTLYGTTSDGGGSSDGTVFKVNTDGSGFSTIYSFTGGSDGALPSAGVVLSGSTLYGAAPSGGSGFGTVFKINTNGTGFSVIYPFMGSFDGGIPGQLLVSNGVLYGPAAQGADGFGTVFSLPAQ